jgi:predicted dehydrogenase/RimJ/RimL family protein N-acetyltransferase
VRVAILGQGSIGRRHAAIALALGHEAIAYDPSPAAPSPPGVQAASSARACLTGADAAIVASPSSEHAADARLAIELGVPALVEKPLALGCAHAAELDCLARERGAMLSVAMSLREHAGVRKLRALLSADAVGRVVRASAWCGSWLPGWRAGGDYRRSYSAHREQGGGVLLDVAVHELDYLLWLTGPARSVSALARHASELETDAEDVALIAVELARGAVAEVSVDCFDRAYTRGCRLVGARGTLHWSWERQLLTRYDDAGGARELEVSSDVAPAYRRQLERFLAAVEDRGRPPVPAAQARHVLAVLDAARASSRDGRRVAIAPEVTLRAVEPGDLEMLRAWRNDPDTRRWSRGSHEIAREEHARWLRGQLANAATRLWVAESDGRPVGHVRVTPATPGSAAATAELHVVMAPAARGRGLGAATLVEATACALAQRDVGLLRAHVKPDHEVSLRAFARAGFSRAGVADDGLLRLERAPAGR